MTRRTNIPGGVRSFLFSLSGNDDWSGGSPENPKRTVQACIDAAASLIPPPSSVALAQVAASQGGLFSESFVLSNSVQFDGTGTAFILNNPIGVTLASGASCAMSSVVNAAPSSVAVLASSIQNTVMISSFIGVFGDNSDGIKISGVCDDLFFGLVQVEMRGTGATGFLFDGTASNVPIDVNVESVLMTGNDSVFVEMNSPNAMNVRVASIASSGSNTTMFHVKQGKMVVDSAAICQAATLCHVENGATLILSMADGIGDIIVDAGGLLICDIQDYTGNITNNGDIDGVINGVNYGSYVSAIESLKTAELDTKKVLRPDGSEGVSWEDANHTYSVYASSSSTNKNNFVDYGDSEGAYAFAVPGTIKQVSVSRTDTDDANIELRINGVKQADLFTTQLVTLYNVNIPHVAGDLLSLFNDNTNKIEDPIIAMIIETP